MLLAVIHGDLSGRGGSGVWGWAVLQVGDRGNHPRPDPWSVADTDLAVDGLLIDFKSTRYTRTLCQAEACPLIGYLLLDIADQYRIDTVGLYLSRFGMLASRLMEENLELLGACRRDIAVFRGAFIELLESRTVDDEPYEQEEEDRVRRLLRRLAPVIFPARCHPIGHVGGRATACVPLRRWSRPPTPGESTPGYPEVDQEQH